MTVSVKKCGPLTYVLKGGKPAGILVKQEGQWVMNQGIFFGHMMLGADTLRDIASILDALNVAVQHAPDQGEQLPLDLGGLTP